MSYLQAIGALDTIQEVAKAAKQHAADVEAQTSTDGFPAFELADKTTKVISILPGCSSFPAFAGVYADGDIQEFAEQEITRQMQKLGIAPDGVIPSWSQIPAHYAAPDVVATLFVGGKGVKNSGNIDYSEYPAKRLRELAPDHPRNLALTIKGKFGAPTVRNGIYLYCMEHTLQNGKIDQQQLRKQLEAGGFVRLLRLNGPSYSALKSAAEAAQLSGARYITDYHLVVQWQDFGKKTYSFHANMAEPGWHQPDLLPLVLKEIERCGKPLDHADCRKLSDDEFEALVRATLGKQEPQQVPS